MTNSTADFEGIVDMFEAKLKRGRSSGGKIDYKLADLEAFVDDTTDFVAMVYVAMPDSLFSRLSLD